MSLNSELKWLNYNSTDTEAIFSLSSRKRRLFKLVVDRKYILTKNTKHFRNDVKNVNNFAVFYP